MTSTNLNHGPLADNHEPQMMDLPFIQKTASTSAESPGQENPTPEKSWKPVIERRQSWSHQDQKHQLQERLLRSEQGKELGFTEAHSES